MHINLLHPPGKEKKKEAGLLKLEVMEVAFHLYAPRGTGIINNRKSTWMNPIIDGEEAIKFRGQCKISSEISV